ncbi:hypothetical protein GGH94_005759 [Coemansia aciculifera]|uniref:Uncharacterized protein n=1 Tax=Coemansia aciculifera TaxID=417176 RepID=A0A9W8ICY6_9FUNG|nr:hypothetical protein GGH94_005759 [Coemansia aciculifera]
MSAASGPVHLEQMPAHLLSRANGNTNMPEFIDVAQLIAPATVAAAVPTAAATPEKPRPTARIEDVGAAAIAAANQPRPKSMIVNGTTVFDDVETSAPKSNKKGVVKQQSSTSQRQPGMLNRFGDDESEGGFSLKNSALAGVWKAGGLALISVGYFTL